MVVDLQAVGRTAQFTGGAGHGFLGTELILMSRLMEAAADQVEELEAFDSVLVSGTERRWSSTANLTLDGLLLWMRKFLTEDGRRIAEDTGRDGIVAALAPTLTELRKFKKFAQWLVHPEPPAEGAEDTSPDYRQRASA